MLKTSFSLLLLQFSHLLQMSKKIWMSKSTWLVFLSNSSAIDHYFKLMDLPFDSAVMASAMNEEFPGETITEVYRIDKQSNMKSSTFANWDEESGLQPPAETLYWRRNSLDGKILRVVTLDVTSIVSLFMLLRVKIF